MCARELVKRMETSRAGSMLRLSTERRAGALGFCSRVLPHTVVLKCNDSFESIWQSVEVWAPQTKTLPETAGSPLLDCFRA